MTKNRAGRALHGQWSSPWMFVLAASGFVIGLKNIWQFPHHLALYGGSAFLLVYAGFLLVLGLPLLLSQLMLGRLAHASPVTGLERLARRMHAPRGWRRLGTLAVTAGFLVLIYYNVVAGWFLAYAVRAASGALNGLTGEGAASIFLALVREPERQLFWHGLFVVMTMTTVARELHSGLELVVRFVVPAIFVLLLLLVGYAGGSGSFALGFEYFLRLDFTQLGTDGVLVALGDAFFSLGLGVGTFMMYGAYLAPQRPLLPLALWVVAADLVTALLASFAVFPVLFAGGMLSGSGPELVFQSLVVAYDPLPLGALMRTLLFILLLLVAWMSTAGLAEPVVAALVERRGMTRVQAAFWAGLVAWAGGAVAILSLHSWAFSFSVFGIQRTFGLFDVLTVTTSLILLPLTGWLVAVFAGWQLRAETSSETLVIRSPCLHDAWLWINRLVIPALLVAMLFGVHLLL